MSSCPGFHLPQFFDDSVSGKSCCQKYTAQSCPTRRKMPTEYSRHWGAWGILIVTVLARRSHCQLREQENGVLLVKMTKTEMVCFPSRICHDLSTAVTVPCGSTVWSHSSLGGKRHSSFLHPYLKTLPALFMSHCRRSLH